MKAINLPPHRAAFIFTFMVTSAACAEVQVSRLQDEVVLSVDRRPCAVYVLRPPADSLLRVRSGGYFHPLTTPAGVVLTDVAPEDHRHHRGLFLAWVEMQSTKSADFWGWGKHAPIEGCRIVNRYVELSKMGFSARNEWVVENTPLLQEELEARIQTIEGSSTLDLRFRLTPTSDAELPQHAFGGFCLRLRKDTKIDILSPAGVVTLPNPVSRSPERNWPDAAWYAAEITLPDGTKCGAAIINARSNPPTTWHNHREVRMLNPCIVAEARRKLPASRAFELHYRVVTFDGATPARRLDSMAKTWTPASNAPVD